MNNVIIGLYGVFFVLVAYRGNTSEMLDFVLAQEKFVPWVLAILALSFLASNEYSADLVAPFITLLIVTLVVTRFDDIQRESKAI